MGGKESLGGKRIARTGGGGKGGVGSEGGRRLYREQTGEWEGSVGFLLLVLRCGGA